MSRNDLQKFEKRLGLAAYFMRLFGVSDPTDERCVRSFLKLLGELSDGYHGERSYVADQLALRGCGIPAERLFEYDANIRRHVVKLNEHRTHPITLKYFQMLAALCTEVYLDRMSREPAKFRHDINLYLREANEEKVAHYQFDYFNTGDLNKLAFWMATGSGKTLVMHINYYQWLYYAERDAHKNVGRSEKVDNILLLTPNAGLSRQHIEEMRLSGIPCRHFHDPDDGRQDIVKVLEITKLGEDVSGSGESVDIDAFEGNNLILVDEGHKGASGDAWMEYRRRIAQQGFTFEYSATFGQAIAGGTKELQLDYGRSIALNYSYPYFHEDGYGKDYHILNLERDIDRELTDRYLLANLLIFVEQKLCYAHDADTARRVYNIAQPLLLFVGNSVTAGKTLGSVTGNEKKSLSDVQKLVAFLDRVLRNEGGWVAKAIDLLLAHKSGLLREDGTDLFDGVFSYLKTLRDDQDWDGRKIYAEMLAGIFHTDTSSSLQLVNLQGADGELGLRAGSTDRYFGVIDIGNERAFMALAEIELPEITTDDDTISTSLFKDINQHDSDVQMLLGSRKFIEGWSSWRVSAMGLMNFGQSPGPLIIQLFGRGVRLLGKGQSLKRSRKLEGASPEYIRLLETLHIFGVNAKYMRDFKKYLEREGIDVDEWQELEIPVPIRIREEFSNKGLMTPRIDVETGTRFVDEEVVAFAYDRKYRSIVDLRVNVEDRDSFRGENLHLGGGRDERSELISPLTRRLIDWSNVKAHVWQHARAMGYENLVMNAADLRRVIEKPDLYTLYCPKTMLAVDTREDLRRVERIVSTVLTKYIDNLYGHIRKEWEDKQRRLVPLTPDDPNFVEAYRARYRRDEHFKKRFEELEKLEAFLKEAPDELFEQPGEMPPRVYFERHLYTPLLLDNEATTPRSDQLLLQFSPPGLNRGETRFVRDLADFCKLSIETGALHGFELYLLRNQSRGAGVSFSVQAFEGARFEAVYPDFIVWLKSDRLQHIVFFDPHGLAHAGNIFRDAKVRLHETIKQNEALLALESGRLDVHLHSFVISTTKIDNLPNQYSEEELARLQEAGVYFPEKTPNYFSPILERVINGGKRAQ